MTSPTKLQIPITNKKAKLSMIHIAKKETGIADDAYRIILDSAAGIDSAAKIEFEWQFKAVMKAFENLGFKSTMRGGKTAYPQLRPQWTDEWGGTKDQRAKIEVLWQACARNKTEKALRFFIKRITRVDHPRFLNVELARKVILALEAMTRKNSNKKEKANNG